MAAITASYSFFPAITGGGMTVTGNTETEIKEAVKSILAQRLATQQATVQPIQTALDEMNQ